MQRRKDSTWFPRLLVFLSIAGLMLVPATAGATPLPADSCETVSGTIDLLAISIIDNGQLVGFDITATEITGSLAGGSMTADVVVEQVTPGGTVHMGGVHSFVGTPFGDFETEDNGFVTPKGQVNNHLLIVEGASGFVTFHGSVDLATGAATGPYHGRVCA